MSYQDNEDEYHSKILRRFWFFWVFFTVVPLACAFALGLIPEPEEMRVPFFLPILAHTAIAGMIAAACAAISPAFEKKKRNHYDKF